MTQPTLQECLDWLNGLDDEEMDIGHTSKYLSCEWIDAIRTQLEAGKRCAEALQDAKLRLVHAAIINKTTYAKSYLDEALSRATATGLIEGE